MLLLLPHPSAFHTRALAQISISNRLFLIGPGLLPSCFFWRNILVKYTWWTLLNTYTPSKVAAHHPSAPLFPQLLRPWVFIETCWDLLKSLPYNYRRPKGTAEYPQRLWVVNIPVTPTIGKEDVEAVGRVQIPSLLSLRWAALGGVWCVMVWSSLRWESVGNLCEFLWKVNKCPALLLPSPGSVGPTFPAGHDSAQPSNCSL